MLMERYPSHLRREHGPAMGYAFVKLLKDLAKKLGGDFEHRPLSASLAGDTHAKSSAASAGDRSTAFAELVMKALVGLIGSVTL